MIKAVTLDLDGTLYDYQACDQYAMQKLKKHCIERFSICAEDFDVIYGKAKEIVKKRLGDTAASHNRMLYMQTFLELICRRPAIHALELYDIYWDTMLENMKLYDYVLPLFRELSGNGIRIAVLTDLTAHIQHRKIQKLQIAEYIDVFVTSEEAGKEKPDGAVYHLLAKKLGLLPDQIIMIGDSEKKDIQGARAAGMYGILYRSMGSETIIQRCMEMIKNENNDAS